MTWADAAGQCAAASESTSEEIEEAECFRRSQSIESVNSSNSELPLAPELYWLQPLISCLTRHVSLSTFSPVRVGSACTGTCAEGSVLKDGVFLKQQTLAV